MSSSNNPIHQDIAHLIVADKSYLFTKKIETPDEVDDFCTSIGTVFEFTHDTFILTINEKIIMIQICN